MGVNQYPAVSGNATVFNEIKTAPDYIAGRYYTGAIQYAAVASQGQVHDFIMYAPFIPFKTHTFDRLSIKNTDTVDNGKKIRLGIYADDGYGRPGARITSSALEITLDGTEALNSETISEELVKGTIYWLASLFDTTNMSILSYYYASAATVKLPVAPILPSYGFEDYQIDSLSLTANLKEAYTYAALPDNASPDTKGSGAHNPVILLRG